MSTLSYRSNTEFAQALNGAISALDGYVVVYAPGGIVSQSSTGNTVTLYTGHGFTAGSKFMRGTATSTYSGIYTVSSVSANGVTISLTGNYVVNVGDTLVNLGTDTGVATPNYDGSTVVIYSTPDTTTTIAQSRITLLATGFYQYWHQGLALWELVFDGAGVPAGINLDVGGAATRVNYAIRYAHLFATSGSGTRTDPWVTSGSNPIQAALNDIPATGGTVYMIAGHFDLGSADPAVTIPILVDGTDLRAYTLRGEGRDLTWLRYSGTGTAIRYAQPFIGATTGSFQSNQLIFDGFALQQWGTPRTGNAFWGTYVSESLFQNLTIGNTRQERQPEEQDHGWARGLRFESVTIGHNVCDFNRIDNCYMMGNEVAIYMENQGDNTVISRCGFEPRQEATIVGAQDGVWIHNSYGITLFGNHFNFFGKANPSTFGALKISGNVNGTSISGNYFEGNIPASVWIYTDLPQRGVSVTGNSVSFNGVTGATGIRTGLDGVVYTLTGLNVSGNGFYVLSATNTGIRYGSDVKAFVEGSNGFDNTGGTNRVAQRGCQGMVMCGFTDANVRPIFWLIDSTYSHGRIYLENSSTSSEPSPPIQFKPGGSGSRLSQTVQVTAAGELEFLDDNGIYNTIITQAGALTTLSNITSGGHLQGLKATYALSGNDAIATSGRHLIDITNTTGTNTFTLVAPSSVDGKFLLLRCVALAAGTMTLADSGTCSLSAAWVPNADDTLTLVASGAVWYELARSAN